MPIAATFTATAALAMLALLLVLREFILNRRAIVRSRQNGLGLEVTTMLIWIIGAFLASDGLLLLTGVGSLLGLRVTAYSLALIPLVYVVACWQILASINRQQTMARKP